MIRDLDKQQEVNHHYLAKRDRRSIVWAWCLIIASLWVYLAGTLQAGVVNHVIHVSVDGLHASQLFNLMYSKPQVYDNFKRFVDEGTTTFNARTDATHTTTLPNHTSIITGRPVSQFNADDTLHHGYTRNGWPDSTWTLHDNDDGNPNVDYIASTFDVAHDYGLSTAMFANKTKFVIYEQSYNATESTPGGRDDQYLENGDQGTDKIDRSYTVGGSTSTNMLDEYVMEMEANHYNYTLLHFVEPDHYGHRFGWGTPVWNASVSLVDDHLGMLFDLVDNNSTLNGNTAIVLTSDHGGEGFGHSSISDPDNFTVPFFVWGAGATPGSDLYALNPFTRASPGISWAEYSDSLQPIRNGGSGNLALSLLGLPAIDGSLINAAQDLVINFPENANWDGDDPNFGSPGDGQSWNDANNWSRKGTSDKPFHVGDRVTFRTGSSQSMIDLEGNRLVTSLVFEDDYRLSGGTLTVNSGNIQVNDTVVATIDTDLVSPSPFFFKNGLGTLQIDGTARNMYVVEGVLSGNGVISGTLHNYHIVNPGSSAGVLVVDGSYSQQADALLQIELSGTTPGVEHDQLVVNGVASLAGTLAVSTMTSGGTYTDPVVRGQEDSFVIITTGFRLGVFSTVTFDGVELIPTSLEPNGSFRSHQSAGLFREIIFGANTVELRHLLAMPGDVDGDNDVDTVDLTQMFVNFTGDRGSGKIWTTGDNDGDNDTDTRDLTMAIINFTGARNAAAAVPEPSSLLLLVLAAGCLAATRGRSCRNG